MKNKITLFALVVGLLASRSSTAEAQVDAPRIVGYNVSKTARGSVGQLVERWIHASNKVVEYQNEMASMKQDAALKGLVGALAEDGKTEVSPEAAQRIMKRAKEIAAPSREDVAYVKMTKAALRELKAEMAQLEKEMNAQRPGLGQQVVAIRPTYFDDNRLIPILSSQDWIETREPVYGAFGGSF